MPKLNIGWIPPMLSFYSYVLAGHMSIICDVEQKSLKNLAELSLLRIIIIPRNCAPVQWM